MGQLRNRGVSPFVVAIIALAFIICCWLRSKGQRRSRHRHRQLLYAVTSAIVPRPPSSRARPERPEAPGSDVSAFEAAKWFRTPSGWASVPGAYLPSPGVMPALLPFPQFPPIVQDYGQQGNPPYSGYPVPRIDFRGREAVQYTCRPAISGSSHFVELSDEPEPVVQRQRARRSQTTVPVSASASRSSSRTCFSNVPSGSESIRGWGRRHCFAVNPQNHHKEKNNWRLL